MSSLPSALTELTLAEALKGLKKKAFSARLLMEAYLKNARGSKGNAFLFLDEEKALQDADQSDKRLAAGTAGLLEGLPIAVKDNICTKDVPTTAASKMLENFCPPYEATVTQRLWRSGAILQGKVNMDEFAMGSGNITSYKGPVENPWKRRDEPHTILVPGGSSGGSSAAVAEHIALAALGTDTGGSIRQPAAYTGLVGMKPTYGRCSRWGIIPLASSLDQVGPMTRTVEDAALLLEVMAGHDPADATSSERPVGDYVGSLAQGVKGLKIGIPKEYKQVPCDPALNPLWEKATQWLQEAGAEIQEVSLPHIEYALQVYSIIMCAESSSNLSRFDGIRYGFRAKEKSLYKLYRETRDQGFGAEVKRRILTGTYVLSQEAYDAYFKQAQRVRRLIFNDFEAALKKVDVMLFPTAPESAFPVDKISTDPTEMYRRDIFTVTANLAGVPSISVPMGLDSKEMPLGLQCVSGAFREEIMLKVAYVLERAANFPRCPRRAGL